MYALALIRYRKPLDEVLQHQEAHRAYLKGLQAEGTLLASGPMEPRSGGVLLLRVPDGDPWPALDRIREGDPYVREGVAQYEVIPWNVVTGRDALDRL